MDDLGDMLVLLRRRRRWSIRTLARRSGVPAVAIARWEAGDGMFDADSGGRLIRTLTRRDPPLYAMALVCCATFHAEIDERELLCRLAHADVAGCA
jgi:transcriptional regulator with XRE-family HTH domain